MQFGGTNSGHLAPFTFSYPLCPPLQPPRGPCRQECMDKAALGATIFGGLATAASPQDGEHSLPQKPPPPQLNIPHHGLLSDAPFVTLRQTDRVPFPTGETPPACALASLFFWDFWAIMTFAQAPGRQPPYREHFASISMMHGPLESYSHFREATSLSLPTPQWTKQAIYLVPQQ